MNLEQPILFCTHCGRQLERWSNPAARFDRRTGQREEDITWRCPRYARKSRLAQMLLGERWDHDAYVSETWEILLRKMEQEAST